MDANSAPTAAESTRRGPDAGQERRPSLRSRLGRSGSRRAVIWAVLTALAAGLFGAAASARVGWQTAEPLPTVPAATKLFSEVLPGEKLSRPVWRSPALFVLYEHPVTLANASELVFGDAEEYQEGRVSAAFAEPAPANRTPAELQRSLRAKGWQLDGPPHYTCFNAACAEGATPTKTTVLATRGEDILTVTLYSKESDVTPRLSAELNRAAPWPVYALGLLGGLLGAALGWFVFAWASRRSAQHAVGVRAGANVLLTTALLLWWLPIVGFVPLMLHHQLTEPHPQWHPLWEWLGQPFASRFFLLGCGSALLALGLAALPNPSRRSAPARLTQR